MRDLLSRFKDSSELNDFVRFISRGAKEDIKYLTSHTPSGQQSTNYRLWTAKPLIKKGSGHPDGYLNGAIWRQEIKLNTIEHNPYDYINCGMILELDKEIFNLIMGRNHSDDEREIIRTDESYCLESRYYTLRA